MVDPENHFGTCDFCGKRFTQNIELPMGVELPVKGSERYEAVAEAMARELRSWSHLGAFVTTGDCFEALDAVLAKLREEE